MRRIKINSRALAVTLGVGLALFPIHFAGQPAKQYFFLPVVGLSIIAIVLRIALGDVDFRKLDLGSKWVYVPMLVIAGSAYLRLAVYRNITELATALFFTLMVALYIGARKLGKDTFMVFPAFVLVIALSIIVMGFVHPSEITGGLISNYCASVGFILIGFMASGSQGLLLPFMGVAVFLAGALEGVFGVASLGLVALIRRDYGRRVLVAALPVLVVVSAWFALGYAAPLYKGNGNLQAAVEVVTGKTGSSFTEVMDKLTTNRWSVNLAGIKRASLLGYGFDMGANKDTVHNVPLIVIDQLGISAGVAWLVATVYLLIKTKWKYLWASVLILSVFDHYVFTQFHVWWWAFAGVTTVELVKNDYIFRANGADATE